MRTKTVFQTNLDGLFLYEAVANELALQAGSFNVPYGAVDGPPPQVAEGQVARWAGAAWESVEDHRSESLYRVDTNEPYTAHTKVQVGEHDVSYPGWGPLPGWLTNTPPVVESEGDQQS